MTTKPASPLPPQPLHRHGPLAARARRPVAAALQQVARLSRTGPLPGPIEGDGCQQKRSAAGAEPGTCARAATAPAQPVTTVELFFDLVYVFAVTQLSHLIVDDLTVSGRGERRLPAARRLVGVDLHDVDGQLVRPGVGQGPPRAHRRDARQPADGRRAAGGARREGRSCSRARTSRSRSGATPRRRCCSSARTRCATSSRGCSCGAPPPACCGSPAGWSPPISG